MNYGSIAYHKNSEAPQEFLLRLGSVTIGSAPENDLVLTDESVDRYHLRLLCSPDACWAIDLESSSGIFLNQARMQPGARQLLRNGDTLRVGGFTIRYRASSHQVVLPPEVAARLPAPAAIQTRRTIGNAAPPRMRRFIPTTYGASSYLSYLPPPYQEDDFMGRFLLIFESILDPIERTIDQIHLYFDPWLTPEGFLPWLASWVDVVLNEKWPLNRRRALVAAAAELYRWRGTKRGLSEHIRIFSGFEPLILEWQPDQPQGPSALKPHTFRVILDVPEPDQIGREMVEAIIEAEKPAHTVYQLDIRQLVVE